MSIRITQFRGRKESWQVDIRCELPDGTRYRERKVAPARTRKLAEQWAELRQAHLVKHGQDDPAAIRGVPTVEQFKARFLADYCKAERQKASTLSGKESVFKKHLLPAIGSKRLDQITTEDVQSIKASLAEHSPKTANNVVSVLGRMLRVAVEWEVIDQLPCKLKLLKYRPPEMEFYGFGDYAKLVAAAEKMDGSVLVVVLLGGDAGLRAGEMLALEWSDIDFARGFIVVARSEWEGEVDTPKGGRSRRVPMTAKLVATLKEHQKETRLRGARVLRSPRGGAVTQETLREWMGQVQRKAGLSGKGEVHILRHSFCSHLAMRGAPAMAIKELAGHANLSTTQRYMHLSPTEKDSAIRLLDARPSEGAGSPGRGDQGETTAVGSCRTE
jgi:integrase